MATEAELREKRRRAKALLVGLRKEHRKAKVTRYARTTRSGLGKLLVAGAFMALGYGIAKIE